MSEPTLPSFDEIASVVADRTLSTLASALGCDVQQLVDGLRCTIVNSEHRGSLGQAMSVAEVAIRVGRDHQAVRRAIKRGELIAYHVCGRVTIYEDDFWEWHDSRRIEPEATPRRLTAPPARGARASAANGLRRLLENRADAA
jgi:hypothetical protein